MESRKYRLDRMVHMTSHGGGKTEFGSWESKGSKYDGLRGGNHMGAHLCREH